ncbi:hypothetical protein Daus18300_010152 [Diaporthe australafricana]|uniref:Endoglucanase n=1 Tax=Diaporthe australafricana TaxID=127596 RepID=A0ABR3WBG2_9PEZI
MSFLWRILVASLITQASGHTLMQHPVPFPSQLKDNGPMNKDGSNWPCSGEKEFNTDGIMNIWERGSSQHLQAMGGATHGGGSCQISVTLDLKPTVRSTWRVIHSIQGGCPIRNLTDTNYGDSATTLLPDAYNFTIPDWLPLGRAVMAWTWYGRWSVPEMFMNCAPIMVLGGRSESTPPAVDIGRDDSVLVAKWDQAPLMFEANNGNGCWTANKGSCVEFPDPGESLEVNHECPIDREHMFTGTCGPRQRLAELYRPGLDALPAGMAQRPFLSIFVVMVAGLLFASVLKVVLSKRRKGGAYSKISQI